MDCQPRAFTAFGLLAAGPREGYGEESLRIRFAVGGIAALAATLWTPAAHATRTSPAPLVVHSASVTQSGQDLVWSVQLDTPFSPGALAPDGRSLFSDSNHVAAAELWRFRPMFEKAMLGPQ